MNFENEYKNFLKEVEKEINNKLPAEGPETINIPFRYLMNGGGKRIRPVLCMIACGAAGADPTIAISNAAAIEILHNFTLVHDDIMDRSEMRRNRETVHIKWNVPVGIILGDIMVGHAYRRLTAGKHPENYIPVSNELTRALIDVCDGQAYDMEFNDRKDISIDEYKKMIGLKTARLLESSALIGALSATNNHDTVKLLGDFAYNLGMGFQIQDDLLDISADEKVLGKTKGLDIVEGKKTILIIMAKDMVTDEFESELMERFYKNNGLPRENIPDMYNLFLKHGILKLAGDEAAFYFNNAKSMLEKLNDSKYKDMLFWLVNKIDKRSF